MCVWGGYVRVGVCVIVYGYSHVCMRVCDLCGEGGLMGT